jgi:hypothetical protein
VKVLPSALVASRTTTAATTKAKAIVAFRDISKTGDIIHLFVILRSSWDWSCTSQFGLYTHQQFFFLCLNPAGTEIPILTASLQQIMVLAGLTPLL